ncbi:MAG: Gfo/Idh/MocA family oxidoreductase [Bacteroidota bacterium]
MIKSGVIGLGKMGLSHCAIVNANPNVELVAICDTSSFVLEAFKKFSKILCFTDYKKMLQEVELDAVIVATPTKFHHEIVLESLKKSLHVFCEKPFSLNPEQGQEMVNEANNKGIINQVGFHNRFLGTFQELKRLVDTEILGEIYHFAGEAYGPVVVKEKTGSWRSKKEEGGGCLYDYASHVLDLIHFTLGKTDKVSGTMLKRTFSKEVEDTVYASLSLENGLSGQLSVNWSDETYRKMSTSITVWGKKGKIVCDATEIKIFLKEDHKKENLLKGWTIKYVTDLTQNVDFYLRGEEYSAQMDYFFQCIASGNKENKSSFSNALLTDQTIELLLNDSKTV